MPTDHQVTIVHKHIKSNWDAFKYAFSRGFGYASGWAIIIAIFILTSKLFDT